LWKGFEYRDGLSTFGAKFAIGRKKNKETKKKNEKTNIIAKTNKLRVSVYLWDGTTTVIIPSRAKVVYLQDLARAATWVVRSDVATIFQVSLGVHQ